MVSEEQIRLLPDLDELYKEVNEDSGYFSKIIDHLKPRAKTDESFAINGSATEPSVVQKTLEEKAGDIIDKVRNDGQDARLSEEEEAGLEAIIQLVGRPALFIAGGAFITPPSQWAILNDFRREIETNCQSVGRIEVQGHPDNDWWGTGFLVADDVVMTNRHVAKNFCIRESNGRWRFRNGMTARIDYIEEIAANDSAEFELTEIIGIHGDPDIDLALFRMNTTSASGATAPSPITIAKKPTVNLDDNVYVVGYPASDNRNDAATMIRIFGTTFNVKRLQPGKVRGVMTQPNWFMHDCSTLGGNSGSCVVDLKSNRVLGLHFKGFQLKNNFAVALWRLQDDPLVVEAGLHFD